MNMNYFHLSTEALTWLVKSVLHISREDTYRFVAKHSLLMKFTELAEDYLLVFDKKIFSGKNHLVANADLLRDKLFKGIRNCLFGHTLLEGLETESDARDLYVLFEDHGLNMTRYTYGDESKHMDNLIADVEKPENRQKLENLHLLGAFELLKSAQRNFEKVYELHNVASTELKGKPSVTSLQEDTKTALHNFLYYVEVMSNIDAEWLPLHEKLKEAVDAASDLTVSAG